MEADEQRVTLSIAIQIRAKRKIPLPQERESGFTKKVSGAGISIASPVL